MVVKRAAGFREGLTVACSRQQMDPEICLEFEPQAGDALRNAEPAYGGRYAASVGDLHEGPQLFDVQLGVPDGATQLDMSQRYRATL